MNAKRESPTTKHETALIDAGHELIIGIDEVGAGCLAGPVVACAVGLGAEFFEKKWPEISGLRDSKMLSAKRREHFSELLLNNPLVTFAIGSASPEEIDKINILRATHLAMRRAIEELRIKNKELWKNEIVLVDGSRHISELSIPQQAIVGGDRRVFVIAAASVIAKVYRDKLMTEFDVQFPEYGLTIHKGYGTKAHCAAIREYGPCSIHRISFKPIRGMV
ncbi:MAG: Ribonuclease [candidate division Kazan bacterium GW2011_GWA1_44_22]|uniref:Ribonuclease HII n=1 Tax=candidate division Kazan bacterium GW2011_GWA1_44_22 TaxID=1620410 RepID=A0A0G1I1R1_UNCK3|nr:MAG: Ribonuclease [candidate division Kazan bacterium GW2011_GWA1_44_22]